MAVVTLPSTPRPASVSWELVDFGGVVSSTLGGSSQRVNRLGNRWKVGITMPPLTDAQAREWATALTKGLRNGVAWKVSQPGVPTGSPGTPLVNGASQTGNSLIIDGLTPYYVIRDGQWLSVTISGQRYLYQANAATKASSTGTATVEIEPALRVSPADNDAVDLATPHIEGLLDETPGWQIDPDHISRGFTFVISETR